MKLQVKFHTALPTCHLRLGMKRHVADVTMIPQTLLVVLCKIIFSCSSLGCSAFPCPFRIVLDVVQQMLSHGHLYPRI